MKQVLAVAVAALLVALAIVVRDAIDDDGDDSAEPDTRDDRDDRDLGDLVVACVTELEDVCLSLDATVRVEDPDDTIAAADDVDAWITFDPWPEIAELQEQRAVFTEEPIPVAASDLVLLARRGECDVEATWSCLLAAGSTIHSPPLRRALGPLVLAHAGVGLFGGTFVRNDLDEQPDFAAALRRVRRDSRDPVADMLQLFPAGPRAAGTTRADVDTRVASAARAADFEATDGGARAQVAVVVVGPSADSVAEDDALLEALAEAGWELDPEAATTGLPSAGVLLALTQELR